MSTFKTIMTDEEWDQYFRDWFPNGPIIPQAVEYARQYPLEDEKVLAKVVRAKFPQVNGENLVKCVRGYRLNWNGDTAHWLEPLARKRARVNA